MIDLRVSPSLRLPSPCPHPLPNILIPSSVPDTTPYSTISVRSDRRREKADLWGSSGEHLGIWVEGGEVVRKVGFPLVIKAAPP